MKSGIIICGLNGAGKSTIGKEISKKLNYKLIDVEDYYFKNGVGDYKYDFSISKQDVVNLILSDIKKCKNFIMVACVGDYGNEINSYFTQAIVIDVPKDERLKRVRKRSLEKFGKRILKGGDLYEKEEHFFKNVENKTDEKLNLWLNSLKCPIIRVEGNKSIQEIVDEIMKYLNCI